MTLLLEAGIVVLLMILYAVIHSLFASFTIKEKIFSRYPVAKHWYRFFYNILALVLAYLFLVITPKPDYILYDLPFPYDIIIVVVQLLSLIGIMRTLKYFDGGEFLGIRQILRYYHGVSAESDERMTLTIAGPFLLVRHPLYFFSLLFLALRPQMSLFYALIVLGSLVYFYIGSLFEEKKLVKVFGDEYLVYQQQVPRLIPTLSSLKYLFRSR